MRFEALSGREIMGFLFADLFQQSGDKIAFKNACLSIVHGLDG
jgi:hypothetical protein